MNTDSSPVHCQRKTSITDLPPELFSIIFNFAHEGRTPVQLDRDIIPSWMRMEGSQGFGKSVMALVNPTKPEDPNVKSRTLFPYSLAAVCSLWRDILYSHPEFWTLVVLFVDSKPTPLVEASLLLKRSRKHKIDVFITRRDGVRPTFHPDLHEKCYIDAFLHILKPHLRRCRSLHVDAHLSSSFPIIHTTFNGIEALNLELMELICDKHAFADDESDSDDSYDDMDEFDPNLARLVIDGNNFRLTSENLDNWLSSCTDLQQITIAHYEPGKNDDYSLQNLLDSIDDLPWLDHLKLEGLHFPVRPGAFADTNLMIPYVHLEDVSQSFIEDFAKFALFNALSVLRITRCPLTGLYRFDSDPDTLILEDIGSNVDLLEAITHWAGENLWLDRCHSFSSAVLKTLGRLRIRSETEYPCNNLCRLLLYRLPRFSIKALKKMIERRNKDVTYGHSDWKTTTDFGPSISHLAVVQCGVGELSAEDEKWFRSHLVEFYWIP
ncbi:hypothetical protein M413DRAFT_445833 [Hebeloma cylindrosporum]|uniref:F-box domain-containing protein n=1 Tax=Hebeloma cylindrosporum TaxID=76867 RepID=A0A0C3BX42_HEBCY|nr:hypothetical protein M413DRAFT_445833 [Hebeloma cylindrosporum h7]